MKKIDLFNTTNRHNLDRVSCYERPISDILNYYHELAGDLFIIVSKIYDSFKSSLEESTREKAMEFACESLGYECEKHSMYDSKFIAKSINDNIPVIVCADLKEVFFTPYYERSSWPHWFLIKGCDGHTRRFCILDNIQFSILGKDYDDFMVTEEILKKASKCYKKTFGECSFFRLLDDGSFDYAKALIKVLKLYCSFDKTDVNIYTQINALKSVSELCYVQGMDGIIDELKRRTVNVNKSKEVIAIELLRHMKILGFDEHIVDLENIAKENSKRWSNYTLRAVVNIARKGSFSEEISNRILENENEYDKAVRDLLSFINNNKELVNERYSALYKKHGEIHNEDSTISVKVNGADKDIMCENNDDIISENNGDIVFDFSKGKLYNWWLEDDAPKAILYDNDVNDETVSIRCKVRLDDNYAENHFQIGMFVRNRNNEATFDKAYMGAIDSDNMYILNEVGERGIEIDRVLSREFTMQIRVAQDNIYFSIDSEDEKSISFNNVGRIDMGIACKTWGNGGQLGFRISNINIEAF